MAIKLPDPGNGIPEQKTGNDEWTNMNIVRDNFADQSNAASRLVGTETGNVAEITQFGVASGGYMGGSPIVSSLTELEKKPSGFYRLNPYQNASDRFPEIDYWASAIVAKEREGDAEKNTKMLYWRRELEETKASDLYIGGTNFYGTRLQSAKIYTTLNTTVDVNKNIKTSSPVLQVFKDGVKKIHEANQLPIKFTRNGVGDYTIEGTTGLRENDWQIVIPKDDHDNQMIAFTMKDDNGTIHLKTYKRIFSMETFLFGPDLTSPVDIPDGLWIDLHFNDLPQEQLDEPTI